MKADHRSLSFAKSWTVRRLRHAATFNPSKAEVRNVSRDTKVSFLPMESIGDDGKLDLRHVRTLAEVESGYTYMRDDDVIEAKITPCFENGKGAVVSNLVGGIGFGTTELTVVRAKPGVASNRYLYWFFASSSFRGLGEAEMYGAGGQKRVPDEFFRNFEVALPPIRQQNEIARYLDAETAKIDRLTAEQRLLIELLNEKRQAVISHAVTKGLNSDAPTKPSGIEWLGSVPMHWEVVRVKWAARMESGHTPDKKIGAYWEGADIPWVSLNDTTALRCSDFISDTAYQITQAGIDNSSARILPAGAVVFSRDATIGCCAITSRPMAVSQHFIAWLAGDRLVPEFLLRVFRAMGQELDRRATGATVKTIGMTDVRELTMALPPKQEQTEIVSAIRERTGQVDRLIEESTRAIALLRERRAALIAAAVTGQIDVRELTPAEIA